MRRQYAEAVKICRLGLLGSPTLLEGRLVLGMALVALQRWDEVLAEMRIALEIDPSSALAWLLKGEALVGKSDFKQAETALKKAKALDPSNSKADELLAEIGMARAAGFEGVTAEPTDTKVYPAKAAEVEPTVAEAPPAVAASNSDEVSVEYEEDEPTDDATQVDPQPVDTAPPRRAGSKPQRVRDPEPEPPTETFLREQKPADSYESPATDDYAEKPRPPVVAANALTTGVDLPAAVMPAPAPSSPGARESDDYTGESSIELSSGDLVRFDPSRVGPRIESVPVDVPLDTPPPRDLPAYEDDESTSRRNRRQILEEVSTRPETPERGRARPRAAPTPAAPPAGQPRSRRSPARSSRVTIEDDEPWADVSTERKKPGVVRVPIAREATTAPSVYSKWWEKLRRMLGAERLPRGWFAVAVTSAIVVIAVSTVTGLLVREWRMRSRIAKRHELARQKLLSGNYPGFQAAELLYRQILTERDDPPARALRARVLAQMAFEFGDDPSKAERAVAGVAESDTEEAQAARVYLAMAHGELERAQRLAQALRHKFPDGQGAYLVGRAELLLERPETAADALRSAAERETTDPIVLHALGMAEAAARRLDKAFAAYKRALAANANHIATLIDRAVLQIREGQAPDIEAARVTLEGVVTKLVGDASSGQLARGFLGLAELALARGDLAAARSALANALAKRREDDTLLAEDLARSFARAFDLDQAEREAQRALLASGRIAPRLILADVALRRGQPKKALKLLDDAGAARPEALVLRARAHLELGSKDAARADVEPALRLLPDLIPARVMLARVEIADGHPERAQRELDRLERSVKLPDVAAARGEVFLAMKPPDRERARFWWNEARHRDPLAVEPRLELARLEAGDGRLDVAHQELDEILRLNPACAPARRDLANIHLATGDAVAARDQFDALVEKDPDVATLLGGARAHLVLGDVPGARERLEKADKLVPTGAALEELADLRAMAAIRDHEPDQAIQELTKLASQAQRPETAALLMEAELDLDRPQQAARVRLLVPPRLRGSVEFLVMRARLAMERGTGTADALASAALERLRGPGASRWLRSQALVILGRSQWEQGSFRPAQRSLKMAGDLDPMSARAFYYLGLVDEELGRREEATGAIEQAVKNDPRYGDALYNLGRMRQEAGDARFREAFQQYLEVAPRGVYAEEAKRGLEEALKPTSSPPQKKRRAR